MGRDEHLDGTRQVRRQPPDHAPLVGRLDDQPDVALLQVAYASVDQLRRSTARSDRKIAALDQGNTEAAQNRVARDTGAGDSATDDEQIELVLGKPPEGFGSGSERETRH